VQQQQQDFELRDAILSVHVNWVRPTIYNGQFPLFFYNTPSIPWTCLYLLWSGILSNYPSNTEFVSLDNNKAGLRVGKDHPDRCMLTLI
jgi:hypothetical protein